MSAGSTTTVTTFDSTVEGWTAIASTTHFFGNVNSALNGGLRGGKPVTMQSYLKFIAPLSGSLVTLFGSTISFRMLFNRAFATLSPYVPRDTFLTFEAQSGQKMFIPVQVASQVTNANRPTTWQTYTRTVGGPGWTVLDASGNTVLGGAVRPTMMHILSNVQR